MTKEPTTDGGDRCPKCGSDHVVPYTFVTPDAPPPPGEHAVTRRPPHTCQACGHLWGWGRLNLLPLGDPDPHDVESAALLYLEYDARGLLDDDRAATFAMSVADYDAVYRRALQIKAERRIKPRQTGARPNSSKTSKSSDRGKSAGTRRGRGEP